MIGKSHWSTGIILRYYGDSHPAWQGTLDFLDELFVRDDPDAGLINTRGTLETRFVPTSGHYADTVAVVIDTLMTDAARFGIEFREPVLDVDGEGDDPHRPLPEGWVDLLEEQGRRIGWRVPDYERHRRQ